VTPRPIEFLCLLALSAAPAAVPPSGAEGPGTPARRQVGPQEPWTAPGTARPRVVYGTVPDTGQFLPDTAILARMNDRLVRARDFVEAYFSSYAEFRPRPDSAGRVQFLNTMVNKEVLAHVARRARAPETFEDRIVMAQHAQRVLSNVLFQRAVLDSVREPGEEEIRRVYAQFGHELRLQRILMRERRLAEAVRRDLAERRMTWRDAARRHSTSPADSAPDGDLGWLRRNALDPAIATAVFDLQPGQISRVLEDPAGYAIYRAVERRAVPQLSYPPMRSMIRDELRGLEIGERGGRILAALAARAGMVHDSANIAWAASHFTPAVSMTGGAHPLIEIEAGVPHFDPADTSRLLARWDRGRLTLGGFLATYAAVPPLSRATVATAEAFRRQVDLFALEPYRAELARERGLEKDSLTIALIEKRREELMVDRLYQDSVLSRVRVSDAERRDYYRENLASFITYPVVTYARFHAEGRSEADSLAARLRGGDQAEAILRDPRWGGDRGAIEQRRQNEQGTAHYALLFEELRPGQVAVEGPDGRGHFEVIQSLSFDPGRQLGFEEAETFIDESLQNMAAEKLLNAFLERHKRAVRIVTHPDRVMRVRLVNPAAL
jgi:hypothetical protein